MKKNKFIFLATLSTACLLSLASCQGAQGPKGDQGEPGINGTNGTNGKNGENGEDGNSVRTGKGVPASTLGKDGDSYIDTETFDFYVKADGKWSKEGNIKGASGDAGSQGEDGTSIRNGKGVPADTLGNDGDCYIDLSTFDFYVKADGKWSKEGNIKGEKGEQGEKGDKGTSGSTGSKGDDGKPGETAWSNTILSIEHGYITPSAGSMIANDENKISFTVHHNDFENYRCSELVLKNSSFDNGKLVISADDAEIKDNDYIFTTTMKEGGFVVSANFVETTIINTSTNKKYLSLEEALSEEGEGGTYRLLKDSTFKYQKDKTFDTYAITKKYFIIDLNGHNLTSTAVMNLGYGLEKFSITGNGTVNFNVEDSDLYAINVGTASNTATPEITIDSNVTINTNINGIHVKNEIFKENGKNYDTDTGKPDATLGDYQIKAKLDIKGKVISTGDTALKIEGNQFIRANANIIANIVDGAELSSKGNAIEISDGTLNVTGGTISGKTALLAGFEYNYSYDESSRTTLNLTSGTFKSTDGSDGVAITIKDYGVNYSIEGIRSSAVGSINIGYLGVKTADELMSALKDNAEIVYLSEDITLDLKEDLSVNTTSKYKKIYCRGKALTINLNGNNITTTNSSKDFVIGDSTNVQILNNSDTKSTITNKLILANSNSVTITNAKFNGDYIWNTGAYSVGDDTTDKNRVCVFNFENVDFSGSTCGFGTYGPKNCSKYTFNFNNCTFSGQGNDNNNTGCVVDIFGANINFTECSFTGDRHALVVRAGYATVTDCTFNYTGLYTNSYSWKYDNDVANAMISVGNSGSYDTFGTAKLTFVDTESKGNKFNINDENTNNSIYIVNDGTYNVAVNMTSAVSNALSEKAYVADSTGDATTTIKVDNVEQTIENNKWKAPQD